MANESGVWNPSQVMGHRSGRSEPIDSTDDSGTERLAVDAKVSGVAEVNLDETSDEVTVANTSDGGTTRALAKGDTDGRFQIDVERMGNAAVSMDAGRQNTNATLQVADADASTANPVPARLSDGTDTATITAAGELNVLATAQPGVDVGDVTINNAGGASAVNVQDGGNSLTVDQSTHDNLNLNANIQVANADVANGNPVPVSDAGGSLTVDQATASSLNAQVVGNLAHDGVDSGNPLKVGYKAIAHGANPTAVAADDRTDAYANRHGVPWVIGGHPNVQTVRANYTTAQTNAAIITVGAGTKIVVTRVTCTLDEAATVGVQFRIGFGTASTPTTTGVVATHPGLVPGSIYTIGDGSGILGVGADNEDLRITSEVPTDGSLDVNVSYYTIES